MKHLDLTAAAWADYELLDSGDNRKLERYGQYLLIRPETQAVWQPLHPELWKGAHAEFAWAGGRGSWRAKGMPERWLLSWEGVRFTARLTSFKHTGIFPEQEPNWRWIAERTAALGKTLQRKPRVLNLFGYTGIASIAAVKHGAEVTHVDGSKQSNAWLKSNADLSGIDAAALRIILDDALKFAEREVRRGARYEGIILDPPAFGRGAKGEVWKIEEGLPRLLQTLAKLLAGDRGSFFLLNGYAAGYSARSFLQAVQSLFPRAEGQFGELAIGESGSGRVVPSGIYVRFIA